MPLDWSPLVATVRRCERFLLMTHLRPDADGMGSQLALAEAFEALGKRATIVIGTPLPARYRFLDPERALIQDFGDPGERFANVDAVLVVDTGTWNQLGDFGDFLRSLPPSVERAVIDHHRTQDDLGGATYVDVAAEATGRMAYELIQALGVPITPRMAQHLFMAVALDTGWFRHPNATAQTFALCAELVKLGAEPTPLYERLFEAAPLARLKLSGVALERLELRAGGKVAFTEVSRADFDRVGASAGDTEDLVDYARSVEGVEVALLFTEQHDGKVKISLRARGAVDVGKLAEQFGGGGHRLASGARVAGPLAEAREAVLAAAEAALAGS